MKSKAQNEGAVLKDKSGHPVPLTGINVNAEINDVLSRVTMTQNYENRESKNIEAVYSFPLPLNGILLEFTVTIDGKTKHGEVLKKSKAREVYEDAVEKGDSAAMLEKIDEGLYSMSVGNILAGQKISISFTYAEFNIWNGSLLRFYLPSVVAPKFGSPEKAGIEAYQAPITSLDAQNALSCEVVVTGELQKYDISCPTHSMERTEEENGVHLAVSAFADRDLILEIRNPADPAPYACLGRDGEGYVAAVAITPDFGAEESRLPRDLDIIVDCSGSMSGASISQARVALSRILELLKDTDSFNIIRFGSSVVPLFPERQPCTGENLRKAGDLLETINADLGGTNLEEALETAYQSSSGNKQHNILLITDGEVYESKGFYEKAEKSGCRIFSVGVGSAVSEGLLRKLSQTTNGMPEFVTPNENMAERIVRHFQRMSQPATDSEIVWPHKPDWIFPDKTPCLFHGDTALFFARFPEKPSGSIELRTLSGEKKHSWQAAIPAAADETPCSDLARMAVRRRISGRDDEKAQDLAVEYRLITSHTNYILVEENANAADLDLPEMRQVPQMAPAGFMGMGRAAACFAAASCSRASTSGMMGFAASKAAGAMTGFMGMMGMGMMGGAPARETCPVPAEAQEDEDVSITGGLSLLVDNLKALEKDGVKDLFAAKTIESLEQHGLPEQAVLKLKEILNLGISERVVFVLFLNSLAAKYPDEFRGSDILVYINRSFERLSEQEKTLPDPAQGLLKEVLAL